MGGANELEGRVEMCYNKLWGSVCHRSWSIAVANVVCEQLGHQPTGTLFSYRKSVISAKIIGIIISYIMKSIPYAACCKIFVE